VNGFATAGSIKAAYAYHCMMKGASNAVLHGLIAGLKMDAGRLKEVLVSLDAMVGRWGKRDYLKRLHSRMVYGVDETLLGIVQLAGVGKVKAQKLYDNGLDTYAKIAAAPDRVMLALACTQKTADKIVAQASQLAASEGQ
jgi:replicative superfamily II helicase